MLRRLLSRDASKDAPLVLPMEEDAPVATESKPAQQVQVQPSRKPRSMRDSDIKDEHGRSAEEIAAEAAKEFDIDAVVRKAAVQGAETRTPAAAPAPAPVASQQPVAPQQPVVAQAAPAPAVVSQVIPVHHAPAPAAPIQSTLIQPADPAPQPVAPQPAAKPAASAPGTSGIKLQDGHIFLPGASADEVAKTRAARNAYWDAIGKTDPELLGYPVSPQVMGQPAWPTHHQNFRVVRTPGSLIIASEGLSDPFGTFDGRSGLNGFGLEVFVELVGCQGMTSPDIRKSWAFRAVEYVARVAAHAQTLHEVLSGHEVISLDVPMNCAPEGWVLPGVADPAGALLNVAQPPGRSTMAGMPLSTVSVVPLTPIYPEELESCVVEGPSERRALANDLLTSGSGHRMNTERRSLR